MIIISKDTPRDRTLKNIVSTIIIMILGFGVFTALDFVFPKKLFTPELLVSELIADDEIVRMLTKDSVELAREEISENLPPPPLAFTFPDAPETPTPAQAPVTVKGMDNFFAKLKNLETQNSGKLRIAYYGDSMIEGDFIVQTLRSLFQKKYGGQGVGIIPISTPNNVPRRTIRHNFSPNWQYSSILRRGSLPLGITGTVSFAGENSDTLWVSYKSGTQRIVNPTLIYGKSDNINGKMIVSSQNFYEELPLNPKNLLNLAKINSKDDSIMLKFVGIENIPLYGVEFSATRGVFIDNFALRGSSGLPLIHLNKNLMNAFQQKYNYDLVVLQFGANVIRPDVANYRWYSDRMSGVVRHFRKCFPNADILVISAADKAARYGSEIKTDTLVYSLLRSQKEYASATNASFIDLFSAMGGEGTMAKWIAADPPLGARDFIHFSPAGARIIANAIFDKLEEEFEIFKERNRKKITTF